MAVIRPLLSMAREETAIITSELANAASSSKVPIPVATIGEIGAGRVAVEVNNLTMRQAVQTGLKESSGCKSRQIIRKGGKFALLLIKRSGEYAIEASW
jgi:hypothetical protein